MGRVVFFERNDMAYGLNFNKIESVEIPEYKSIDINDAIEYYEIKRYFNDGARSKDWSDEQYEEYKEKGKKLFGLTMRFLNATDDDNVVDRFQQIDEYHYEKAFWSAFNKCQLYKKISEEVFEKLLACERASLYDVCSYKQIVEHYGNAIRSYILSHFGYVDLILHVYEQDYAEIKKLYIPDELTGQDICDFLEEYIDSDNPNLNFLNDITLMQSTKRIPVTDMLRLKAKRKYQEKSEQEFDNGVSLHYGIELVFSNEQKEEKKVEKIEHGYKFSYSIKWLLDSLDYPSILNNFIYIFEFADVLQMRCQHVVQESCSGVLERVMKSDSSRIYPVNHTFRFTDGLAQMQIRAYYDFLKKNDIRFEDVLEWFFTKYLQEEFGCSEMRISLPSEGARYKEKCISICSEFESIIKQFSLYVEQNEIDFGLLEIMQGSKKLSDIPSLVENKYVYGEGKVFDSFKFTLFSDQCMCKHVRRIYDEGRNYSSLFELLVHEQVFLSDYHEPYISTFRWLEENCLVTIDDNGQIRLGDNNKVALLHDLNKNGVISKWNYDPRAFSAIQEWIESGVLVEKSSLLTEQEVDYFNYILNNDGFDNGLQLRNKYSHGNQQAVTDENVHINNYFYFLRLFTILIIKINDDFILREQLEKERK